VARVAAVRVAAKWLLGRLIRHRKQQELAENNGYLSS